MSNAVKVDETNVAKFDAGTGYLKSLDFLHKGQFRRYTLTVDAYYEPGKLSSASGKAINNPILGFKQTTKKFIASKTNCSVIHMIVGDDSPESIIGSNLTLEPRVVPFGKDMVLGVRVIPPAGTIMPKGLRDRLGSPAVWQGQAKEGKDVKVEGSDDASGENPTPDNQDEGSSSEGSG